jgi:hypothetical protein
MSFINAYPGALATIDAIFLSDNFKLGHIIQSEWGRFGINLIFYGHIFIRAYLFWLLACQ